MKAIKETIKECKEKNILKEYLTENEGEVIDTMEWLFSQELALKGYVNSIKEEKDAIIAEKDRELEEKSRDIEEKNRDIEEKNRDIEEKNRDIEEKNRDIEEKNRDIEEKNRDIEEKNRDIEERNKDIEKKDAKIIEFEKGKILTIKKLLARGQMTKDDIADAVGVSIDEVDRVDSGNN